MYSAKRVRFGNTWWGRAWVDALENIDYFTNRLPRGRRYARNGSVKEVVITDGTVYAKVKGTRPSPYRVKIKLKHFTQPTVRKIKNILTGSPSVIAAISMGQLPEEVNALLDAEGIKLFPESWEEIYGNCSCPDWANPCKHLAAVYYILANEIDKDPFLIFNLRGIKTEEITSLAGLLSQHPAKNQDDILSLFSEPDKIENPFPYASGELPELMFPKMDIDVFLKLLPETAPFYPQGNFKKRLKDIYSEIENRLSEIEVIEDPPHTKDFIPYIRYEKNGKASVFIIGDKSKGEHFNGKRVRVKLPLYKKGKIEFESAPSIKISLFSFIDYLMRLPAEKMEKNTTKELFFLFAIVFVARGLLKQGLFIPEVLFHGKNAFSIRYIPLFYDEKVKEVLDYLKKSMPCYLFYSSGKKIINREGFMDMFSLVLTSMVHLLLSKVPPTGIITLDIFNYPFVFTPSSFEEERIGKAIADYLEGLHLKNKNIMPVIHLERPESKKFPLYVVIQRKDDPLSESIHISDIFDYSKKQILSIDAERIRTDVLRTMNIISNIIPELKKVIDSKGKKRIKIPSQRLAEIIVNSKPILDILGVKVSLPKELINLVQPRIVLRTRSKISTGISYFNFSNILEFNPEIAIGDNTVDLKEFKKFLKKAEGIVKFKNQYLLLTPELAASIMEKLKSLPERIDAPKGLHALLSGRFEDLEVQPDKDIKNMLKNLDKIEDISIPQGLKANLRPYQERGYRWLWTNLKRGFGSCLADDMGLGKTVQVLALIQKIKEDKALSTPALVVCPTTLVGNWQREIERFTPELKSHIYHGAKRKLLIKGKDIVITTYGLLRRDMNEFAKHRWTLIVADEAQNIKNPGSQQTHALKSLKGDGYIAMTGTPVENRLTELWSIFDFINRDYLGNIEWFRKRYSIPIEIFRNKGRIEELKKVTAPFIFRRVKADKNIISDLPEKIIMNEYCTLSQEQTALYQKVLEDTLDEVKDSEGIKRKGLILKLITSLKQICNHPVHYSRKGVPASRHSGKAEKTIFLLSRILERDEKALIFTQFREMGFILKKMIEKELSETVLFFHGGLERKKRDYIVKEFQENQGRKIMIVSLKAGGTGLNLTSATNVIHYDLWWNPAVEDQATDRTYRIGQKRNVMIYRLITMGTFEEKIEEMIQKKRELAELTISKGEQWITELSNRELEELLKLSEGH